MSSRKCDEGLFGFLYQRRVTAAVCWAVEGAVPGLSPSYNRSCPYRGKVIVCVLPDFCPLVGNSVWVDQVVLFISLLCESGTCRRY